MVTYKDVLIRRSAWMRERSDAREPLLNDSPPRER